LCVSADGLAWPINACAGRLGCAPHGRHTLIRFAHPSGQPAAVTPLRSVSLLAQERCAKEGHPTSGFRFAQLPSLRCRSGGRLTRAIPGPLSGAAIGISPHPCGSSPCATPTLGLLTGPDRELARFPQSRTRRRLFLLLLLKCDRTDDAKIPFRRPSGVAA